MIRPICSTDFHEVLEIEAQAAPKSRYGLWELWRLYLRYPRTFLVAVSQRIDGYIVFSPDGHVISMVVRPQRRRCGIGTRLIQRAIADCAGRPLRLEVREGNLGAQKFYRSLGFRTSKRLRCYYHDGEDALLMVRPVSNNGQT